jgi:Protein of unknown function (DUF1588)
MRRLLFSLLLAGSLAACSNLYEIGSMDAQRSGAGTTSAGSSSNTTFAMGSGGTTASAGNESAGDPQAGAPAGGELGTVCVPSSEPAPLTGPFQAPEEVWQRISLFVFGQSLTPLSPLPQETTYDWAAQVVAELFDEAAKSDAAAPGAENFVRAWLGLGTGTEPDALSHDWGRLLAADTPALELLLETPLADAKRIGVFSEQAWLKQYPPISTRGYMMSRAVLGVVVPPEPGNPKDRPDSTPAPGYSRRQQLEANIAYASCQSCHTLIDPLGVSLEHFDGVGAYRVVDAAQPVDASGSYALRLSRRTITFKDVSELGRKLADTCDASQGFASEYLTLGLTRLRVSPDELQAVHDDELARFQQAFIAGGRSYRALVTAFAQSSAVLER